MKKFKYLNIIGFYEVIEISFWIYFVIDMVDGGDLLDYIKMNGLVCENEVCMFFWQLIGVLEYFYNLDVVYRDLKCENILLDCNKNILFIDFGFVRIVFIDYDIGK